VDGFTIRPDDLRTGASSLENFAGDIGKAGQALKTSGDALVSHASGDSSGVGSVIVKAMGKGMSTTGDVLSQAGRLSKGSSDRLHSNADAHEETENNNSHSFSSIHSDKPSSGTTSTGSGGGSRPGGSGESSGGGGGGGSTTGQGAHATTHTPTGESTEGGGSGGSTTGQGAHATTHTPTGESTDGGGSGGSVTGEGAHATSRPGSLEESNDEPAHNANPTRDLPGCGDPVDIATGRVYLTQTDVELRAAFPLVLNRTHLSTYRSGRSFGPTWASTLDQRIEVTAAGVTVSAEDGMLLRYPLPTDTAPVLPEIGPRRPLRRTAGGGWAVTVPEDATTLLFAPGQDQLSALVHNLGGRIDIDRDRAGTPVLVRYGYDADRRLTEVVNSSGRPLRFGYDLAGRLTEWHDRNGMSYRYSYDGAGRCVLSEGDGGYLTYRYAYDRDARITTATDSLGAATTFHLTEQWQVAREVDPLGRETRLEWDANHRLLAETDPLGHTTGYRYDEAGDLVAVTRPDGSQELTEYDRAHRPVAVVDPDGAVHRREYGPTGALLATVDPVGARTVYGYDAAGNVAALTGPTGATTRIECDRRGLVTAVTDPNGARYGYAHDELGRLVAATDPTGRVTRFGWTVEGLPAAVTEPDGATRTWRYDGEGNVREERDPQGRPTVTEIAHFDLPVARITPDGRQEFGYDTELRLVSVRNEQGAQWRYRYDPAGQLVEETDFDGRTLRYDYDLAGRLVRRVNGAGETLEFVRDALGQVIEQRAGAEITRISYDPAGRVLTAVNADAELRYGYDPRGLVVTETCNGRTVHSSFDVQGRRTGRTLPSGARSAWAYDAAGVPIGVQAQEHTLALRKDAAGRDTGRAWGAATIGYDWDDGGRLANQTVLSAAGVAQRRSYTYRPDGLVTGVRDALAGDRAFELDPLGRITAVVGSVAGSTWTERYAYDNTGNITEARWPGEDPRAGRRGYRGSLLTEAGANTYAHDAQGRLVRRTAPGPDGSSLVWEFGWNAEDRLVAVTTPDGARWRYRYDPMGRRIGKQRLGADDAVVEQIDFTWDSGELAEEHHRAADGSRLLRSWELEPGTDLPLVQREQRIGPNTPQSEVDVRFAAIVTDLVGTPTDLVALDGTVTAQPWHTLWGAGAAPAATPLRFPGQYHDPETGLHYNYHRYFDPAAGRYTSPDPLGLGGGPNPQAYVANPLAWMDPLGLSPCQTGGTGASGSGGGQSSGGSGSGGGRGNRRGGRGGGSGGNGQGGSGGQGGGGQGGGGRAARKPPPYYDNPLSTHPVASVPQTPTNPNGRLYHYTVAPGEQGISSSGQIWPSEWKPGGGAANGHARFGSGAYFTDIAPGSVSQSALSQQLVLNPNQGDRFTHYIEVDPQSLQNSGYNIVQSDVRPDVYVVHHGSEPVNQGGPSNVDISGSMTGHGENSTFTPTPATPPPADPPAGGDS
jgi:RHS repeat-associated protein